MGVTAALKLDCCVQRGLLFATEEDVVLAMRLSVLHYYQASRLPIRLHTSLAFHVLRARRRSAACLLRLTGLLSPCLDCDQQHDEHGSQQVLVHGNASFPSRTLPLCCRLRPPLASGSRVERLFLESWRPATSPIVLRMRPPPCNVCASSGRDR